MAEIQMKGRIIKTIWWHIIVGLRKINAPDWLRISCARFIAKHRLCVCTFLFYPNTLQVGDVEIYRDSYYTLSITGNEIKVVRKY